MKLMELVAPSEDPMDFMDPAQMKDNEEHSSPTDRLHTRREIAGTPKQSSNVAKAKRIRNLVRMSKRSSNPQSDETSHQSNLGGHGSTFLFR